VTPIDVVHRQTPAKAAQHDGSDASAKDIYEWVVGAGGQAACTLDDLLVKTPTKWAPVPDDWWVIRGVMGQFFVIEPGVYTGCYDRVIVDYGSDLSLSDGSLRELQAAAHGTDNVERLWEIVDLVVAAALERTVTPDA
jgi:hypothetical protein